MQFLTAKLSQSGANMPSSPESSSDSSTGGSPHHAYDGPNIEAENCLPGVVSERLNRMFPYLSYSTAKLTAICCINMIFIAA